MHYFKHISPSALGCVGSTLRFKHRIRSLEKVRDLPYDKSALDGRTNIIVKKRNLWDSWELSLNLDWASYDGYRFEQVNSSLWASASLSRQLCPILTPASPSCCKDQRKSLRVKCRNMGSWQSRLAVPLSSYSLPEERALPELTFKNYRVTQVTVLGSRGFLFKGVKTRN